MKTRISFLACLLAINLSAATWTATESPNPDSPGKAVLIKQDDQLVARFVFGDGQKKPFLHLYGSEGELLTNGGLDKSGKDTGQFPHHRGIYIGWKITSELGTDDLWHLFKGEKMSVRKIHPVKPAADSLTLIAEIDWLSIKPDSNGSHELIRETRTHTVSRPDGKRTQVDCHFVLNPVRDLTLGGDLQHAGIHFRASNEASKRNKETSYLWEPPLPPGSGKVVSPTFQWARLQFPIGTRWFSATEINSPRNPVEELSWRDYGRFGFFFKRDLKKGESLALDYRFLVGPVEAPAELPNKLSEAQSKTARTQAQADHDAYAKSLKK
ncbi:MAG: hypothetical protein EXS24_04265 [Pedosphaera sp.]|nr:hypothetical protein [Pedosphaera sp.]